MLIDMRQHPQDALLIIIPSCLGLWPCAAQLQAKLANAITGRLTKLAVLNFRNFPVGHGRRGLKALGLNIFRRQNCPNAWVASGNQSGSASRANNGMALKNSTGAIAGS
jgi:hypothetical protein